MDYRVINRLAEIMSQRGLTELEIKDEQLAIRMCRPAVGAAPVSANNVSAAAAEPVPAAPAAANSAKPSETRFITSPMPGTFFSSASPESAPYLKLGDTVKPGAVVGIVEAMKVMNEVKSEVSGKITKILVVNGAPVEYGQKLFEVTAEA